MSADAQSGLVSTPGKASGHVGTWLMRLGSLAIGASALLLYQSVLWIPGVPPAATIAFALFGLLAVFRPGHALLVMAGLTPLSMVLWPTVGLSAIRGAEALALAVVGGWYLRGATPRHTRPDPLIAHMSLLFGLIVAAACIEALTPQALTTSGPEAPSAVLTQFFAERYLGSAAFEFIHLSALLIFGPALAYATSVMSRSDSRLPPQLVRMTVIGGLGAASLSFLRVATALIRSPEPMDLLHRFASGQVRLSPHVADVNAAGSYFVMIVVLALGLAATAKRRAWPWVLASVGAAIALFFSGSQAAIFAGVLIATAGISLAVIRGRIPRRRVVAIGGVAVALVILATAALVQAVAGRQPASSMQIRYYFTQTSLRMVAASPVFGVGVTRYMSRSPQYMPPELRKLYPRENAHNYFLQVTAELGLAGGVLFALLVLVPFVRGLRVMRQASSAPELPGVVGGLGAFLITCLSGHPLLHSQIAFPFWIIVGLTSGMALRARDAVSDASGHMVAPSRYTNLATWAGATLGVLVLISIPIRVTTAARNTSLSHVAYGFHDWEVDSRGRRFRWTTDMATFYVPTGVRIIEMPIRAWNPTADQPTTVEVEVNGQPANRLSLVNTDWTTLRLSLPPRAPDRVWRVDLLVDPSQRPSDVNPRLTDNRLIGVRVGEIQLTPDPERGASGNREAR